MSNPWIEFVKGYAKDNNLSYLCAMCEISKDPNKKGYKPKKSSNIVKEKPIRNEIMKEENKIIENKNKLNQTSLKSNKENKNIIVDSWDDTYLGYIIDNNDKKLMDDMTNLIDKKNKKNENVIDIFLLACTKKYNDDIIDKYGFDVLFNGINTLANHYGTENYVSSYSDKSSLPKIPKGYMSEKNRMLLFKKFNK